MLRKINTEKLALPHNILLTSAKTTVWRLLIFYTIKLVAISDQYFVLLLHDIITDYQPMRMDVLAPPGQPKAVVTISCLSLSIIPAVGGAKTK